MAHRPGSLTEAQVRRLRITCEHIDDLLSGIERILDEPESKTIFPRFSLDITTPKRREIEDCIADIRASMVDILDGHGISREHIPVPATRAIALTLVSIDISAEELRPKYMQAYGDVSVLTSKVLEEIAEELHGLVRRFEHCITEGEARDG
jgi:hypothetical protein